MQKHTKIYYKYFDFIEQDYVPCEFPNCTTAVDVHHVNGRGPGKDVIENLMALCREHHDMCEMEQISKQEAQLIHDNYLREYDAKTKKNSRENNYFK